VANREEFIATLRCQGDGAIGSEATRHLAWRFPARPNIAFAIHVISTLAGEITPTEVIISMAAETNVQLGSTPLQMTPKTRNLHNRGVSIPIARSLIVSDYSPIVLEDFV
jgi:hypothetical protein